MYETLELFYVMKLFKTEISTIPLELVDRFSSTTAERPPSKIGEA